MENILRKSIKQKRFSMSGFRNDGVAFVNSLSIENDSIPSQTYFTM